MNLRFIRQFAHNLFFGTRDRALVSYLGGAVLACLAVYGVPIYLLVTVFGMTLVGAMGVVSDGVLVVIACYIIYRVAVVVRNAWRETRDGTGDTTER